VTAHAVGGDDNRRMFTGIVSAVGRIVEVAPLGESASFGKALTVAVPPGWLDDATVLGDTVTRFERVGESWLLVVAAPHALARFLAFKGSIAVDGVSLTVNDVADDAGGTCAFAVNLIPHTAEHTTLRHSAAGRKVNLEVDLIARYVERMLGGAKPRA